MSVILKGLLYQTPRFAFSGGLGLLIPTGRDANIHVTDFLGNPLLNIAELQRERTFGIANETFSLSPFLAVLTAPGERWFAQGFAQVDIPLNDSQINYSHRITRTASRFTVLTAQGPGVVPLAGEVLSPDFYVTRDIDEQTLLHLDFGTGFWLVRNPNASWITGIAPTLEVHYTTTLCNANIVPLPKGASEFQLVSGGPGAPPGQVNVALADYPPPTVGNLRNRVDILNMTVGTTVEIANCATLATGFAFPLRRESDRTFDWEFQVQLNYYFGGSRYRMSPNF
jgi:hypothetical protein